MPHLCDVPPGYEARMGIVRSIVELMANISLKDITISKICEQADISRTTFYRYFEDKYDAVNWYWALFAGKSLLKIGDNLTFFEGLQKMFENIATEADFLVKACDDRADYNSPVHFAARTLYGTLVRTIVDVNETDLTEDLDFQLDFWTQTAPAFVASLEFYDSSIAPEHRAELMDNCVPRQLHEAMDEPVLRRRRA